MSPPPSPRAQQISAALLVAVMLLVPIGLLLAVRSLVGDWLHFGVPTESSATPVATEPTKDDTPPAVRGRIVDGDGNPVASTVVRIISTAVPPVVLAETKTNREGAFTFPVVDPGSARVCAERDPSGAATSDLVVRDEGTTDVLLVLSTAEAIRGSVVDADGHPIAGATVTAAGVPWEVHAATTDGAGEFRMTAVPHEATSLVASARGYATASASLAARVQATEPTEHEIRLRLAAAPPIQGDVLDPDGRPVAARVTACEGQGPPTETVSASDGTFELPGSAVGCTAIASLESFGPSEEVTLPASGRVTLRLQAGSAIEGVVVDDRGAALPSFTVGVESFSPTRGKSLGRGPSKSFDDVRGVFRLDNLAPGTYVLTASAQNQPPARSEPIAVATGAPTKGVRIVLSAGGIVAGHVYDDQHAPLEGVELSFDQVSSIAVSRSRARTDESGAYRLEGAPAGLFTLRASKPGFRLRMTAGLQVASGATLVQDVTLTGSDGGGGLELGGIGATVEQTRAGIILRTVFPGDPAEKAGLQSGDRLVRIDGEPTEGMSVADVLQHLRGTPGTSVGISVRRGPIADPETVDAVVVRAVVVH